MRNNITTLTIFVLFAVSAIATFALFLRKPGVIEAQQTISQQNSLSNSQSTEQLDSLTASQFHSQISRQIQTRLDSKTAVKTEAITPEAVAVYSERDTQVARAKRSLHEFEIEYRNLKPEELKKEIETSKLIVKDLSLIEKANKGILTLQEQEILRLELKKSAVLNQLLARSLLDKVKEKNL